MPRKRLTTEEIKERIEELTNGEYLLLGNYLGANTKMLIKHNICKNEYEARWGNFQQGYRCPKCSGLEKLNNEEIDKRMFELTKNEYVRIGNYLGARTKMLIKHNVCKNEYMISWSNFNQGARCPRCSGLEKLDNKEIDKRMYELTKNEYLRLGNYVNSGTKILIKHTLCKNKYEVRWCDFQQGSRCPKCNESKGEKAISDILNYLNIKYTSQKRFKDCKYKNTLPFDFYIHNKKSKLLIEFDGRQHFESIEYFGGKETLKETQLRDKIKNDFAEEKNIPLLRIPYIDFDNIEHILTNKLEELNFI